MSDLKKHVTYKGWVCGVRFDNEGAHIRLHPVRVSDHLKRKHYVLDYVAFCVNYQLSSTPMQIRSLLKGDEVEVSIKATEQGEDFVEKIENLALQEMDVVKAKY